MEKHSNKGAKSYVSYVLLSLLAITFVSYMLTGFGSVLGLPTVSQAFFWGIGLWAGMAFLVLIIVGALLNLFVRGAMR